MESELMIKAFTKLIEKTPDIQKMLQEYNDGLPNIPFPTLGGHVFWLTLKEVNGWKLQRNSFTSHYRILDKDNIRQAWGNEKAMEKLFKKFNQI